MKRLAIKVTGYLSLWLVCLYVASQLRGFVPWLVAVLAALLLGFYLWHRLRSR